MKIFNLSLLVILLFTGCATTTPLIVKVEQTTKVQPQIIMNEEEPKLKRKVAIARFSNESQYGKSALFDISNGYNAEKQATDILSAKLASSGKFILLERNDIDKINNEVNTYNLQSLKIGADYLIVGSVSEFGRKDMSDTGVFSRTKIQTAYAKVSVRLIDVKTGQIIFAQEGSGEAKSEAGTSFGLGKHVGYDSTLNDKAISTAISSVVDGIMHNLLSKPWRSYILSIENNSVIIAGGEKQGLKINDTFYIYKKGKSIKNPQTGMIIELPGIKIASVKVISQFGASYTDEGSICQIISGDLKGVNINDLQVKK
jgi:curli biogenesis system outer membrane secretion channel CsgG